MPHLQVVDENEEFRIPEKTQAPACCCKLLESADTNGDVVDAAPDKVEFVWWDFILLTFSIGSYLFDVGTDATLAYFYYTEGHMIYFGLTIAFVVIPAITITGISLSWYQQDILSSRDSISHSVSGVGDVRCNEQKKLPCWKLGLRLTLHFLQLAPVARYVEAIAHGIRSAYYKNDRRRRVCFKRMLIADADACLLRLFEAFMESAPQLVLQLYILASNAQTIRIHYLIGFRTQINEQGVTDDYNSSPSLGQSDVFLGQSSVMTITIQSVSVVVSLISMAWALTSYNRAARFTMPEKKNISCFGCVLYFLWRLGTIVARVLALSLFASVFTVWVGIVCIVRWIVMTAWIMSQQPRVCTTRCQDMLFCCAVGVVYIFSILNVKDEPTRIKYVFYYVFDFVENTALVTLWFVFGDRLTWFYYPALVGQMGSFFLGISFMLVYYMSFHPNGPRPISDFCKRPKPPAPITSTPIPCDGIIDSRTGVPVSVSQYTLSSNLMNVKGLRRASMFQLNRKFSEETKI